MRKIVLPLCFLFLLIFPGRVQAQQAIEFESVQVSLWPEYDRPELLVFYDLTLSSQTSLPANLQIRIPRVAGEPYALSMRGADGGLTNMSFETRIDGEWLWIIFSTPVTEVHIEYYDPIIEKDGEQRSFVFQWPGDYLVHSMKIQIQQPAGGSDMETRISQSDSTGKITSTMNIGAGRTGEDDLVYFDSLIGEIPAGQSVQISSSYHKPDDRLSFNSQPVQPGQPITLETAGRTNLTALVTWILGTLGVLLIVGGAFWYWQSGLNFSVFKKKHRQRRKEVPPATLQAAGPDVYCRECGKRAGPNDLYCRVCGAKLMVE